MSPRSGERERPLRDGKRRWGRGGEEGEVLGEMSDGNGRNFSSGPGWKIDRLGVNVGPFSILKFKFFEQKLVNPK